VFRAMLMHQAQPKHLKHAINIPPNPAHAVGKGMQPQAQGLRGTAHLECSDLVQHHCLELLVADVPVAQHLMDLSAQLVNVAVTATAAAAAGTLNTYMNIFATQLTPTLSNMLQE
jgi:hypothetical protein